MNKLTFTQIENKEEWDNFVLSLDRYSFVQSWDYLNVEETLYSKSLRIGIYENNELIGLLPIGIIKAKRGKYLKMRHGPILDFQRENIENELKDILCYLKELAISEGLDFIRIHPITTNKNIFSEIGFRDAPTHNLDGEETLQLNLEGEERKNSILSNMRKQTRYYIRKCEKEGTIVVKDNSDFDNFYKIFTNTASRQGYTPWKREYYENIFKSFKDEDISLYFSEVNSVRVAFGLFIDYGKYRFYKEGGMDPAYTKHYPSYGIQWRAISDAIDKKLKIYDFWGGVSPKDSNGNIIPNYPWAGINLFKVGFGGVEVSMVHPIDYPLNIKYWLTYVFEYLEKKRRGY